MKQGDGNTTSGTSYNSGSGFLLTNKDAVLIGGAEINVDGFDLAAGESEELGIAEDPAAFGDAGVSDECLVAFDKYPFELVTLDPVAVAPTPLEIGGLVDAVVIRAGEAEVGCERAFNGAPVVRQIRCKNCADDVCFGL